MAHKRKYTQCIRQAATNNAGQPCQRPSHQINKISQGTRPWTTAQNMLQGARLRVHHHQSQRGGPPSWGQGTQQREDDHHQHISERHFVLPAINDRTSSQQITTCSCMHGSLYTIQCTLIKHHAKVRTTIHTTYI